ncbi:MAG: diguanylate cyclase [Thiotrichales bacterium]|nr:diguanylate cyclase [Thiotrichales bacterium]
MNNFKPNPREIKAELNARLFSEMMRGMWLTLGFSLLVVLIISYVLINVEKNLWSWGWLVVSLMVAGLRFFVLLLHHRAKFPPSTLIPYSYAVTFISGMVWASLACFYNLDHPLVLQLMLLMVLGGIPLISLSTHGNMVVSHILFSLPAMVALNYWALFKTPDYSFTFFFMTLFYTFLVYTASFRFYNRIKDSFAMNLENVALVKALQERQTQLENLAYVDSLTELNNRRYFTVSSELALENIYRKNARLYFFLVDADKFKHINDHYGHETGDSVLKHIADCLKASVESFNQNPLYEQGQVAESARLGGDEFIISFVVLDTEFDIESIAGKLLDKIHQPIEISGKVIYPQVSIGISEAPRQARDVSSLLRLADKAMYQAKKHGGDQVFYCHSSELPTGTTTES